MEYGYKLAITKEMMEREGYFKHLQTEAFMSIGKLIGDNVEFKKEETPPFSQHEEYIVKIDAFSHDDWVNFKTKLKEYVQAGFSTLNHPFIKELIYELENKQP